MNWIFKFNLGGTTDIAFVPSLGMDVFFIKNNYEGGRCVMINVKLKDGSIREIE